jgi:hypothetical protein
MMTPSIQSTFYDRSYFPKQKNKHHDSAHFQPGESVKVTIITDADVDQHENDIQERRVHRKDIMDLIHRGVIDITKPKAIRPSSSKKNLKTKVIPVIAKKESHSRIPVVVKDTRRRPMSANPKFITISGRSRPMSAQIKMGEYGMNESLRSSCDRDSDDVNIPEVSEVPRFDETEEMHTQNEEKHTLQKFSDNIMKSRPTTASIFKKDKDFNLPYPELFDRTERTFASCFAKFGNLSYFTAVQRIGCYMDFSARLKRKHLNDIIHYIKHNEVRPEFGEGETDENFHEN